MRHLVKTKKFKRTEEERKRLWIDLCRGLIKSGKVVTFTARAKWFAPKFERLVTLVKRAGDDKKLAYTKVRPFLSEDVARILIEDIVPKMKDRQGGYTRIFKMGAEFSEHDKSIVMIVDDAVVATQTEAPVAEEVKEEKIEEVKEVKEKVEKKASAKKQEDKKEDKK